MAKPNLKELVDQSKDKHQKQDHKFQLHDVSEALQPQPPVEWIIDNFLTAGSVNIFEGHPGSKKTWALLDMAVCVALGKNWLDYKTSQAPVLIIDEESGNKRLTRRMHDVLCGHLVHLEETKPPIKWITLQGINLGDKGFANRIGILVKETKARLVIIDALADVMPDKDENSVKDTRSIFANIRWLADEFDITIIVIHHLNKSGTTRGSTAIPGSVDLVVQIESKITAKAIAFTTVKARDIEPITFWAHANFSKDQVWLTSRDAPEKANQLKTGELHILKYLFKHGKSMRATVLKEGTSTARNSFTPLVERGLIVRSDESGQGTPAEYEITSLGKKCINNL
jgi:predicted ATP-dependent serine protease